MKDNEQKGISELRKWAKQEKIRGDLGKDGLYTIGVES